MTKYSLKAEILPISQISYSIIEQMYKIYLQYYGGTSPKIFELDLKSKNFCILIFDENDDLAGFSSILISKESSQNKSFGIVYSGDTIIKHQYWGSNILIKAWLGFTGGIYRQLNSIPWYWLLLVKGHRTYRYLNLFFKEYYPRAGISMPEAWKTKRDFIVSKNFGEYFNSENNLIKFPETRGFLKEEWNGLNEKTTNHPEVNFFKSQNPGFNLGDELVCFCEISEENFQKRSLSMFQDYSYDRFLPINLIKELERNLT